MTRERINPHSAQDQQPLRPHGPFGAVLERGGVRFRVPAPHCRELLLHLLSGASAGAHRLQRGSDGIFELFVPGARAGDRYVYSINGSDPRPDPASRFQPDGVHGPSEVVGLRAFRWHHPQWRRQALDKLVIYEMHVGTFTRAGTFAAARDRLADLRDLGVTAVELMPIAEFAGARNWGYDGTCLYAPSRNYGRPDDLRAFVDAAHGLGLAVILDVVYNHLGPEGAYLPQFDPDYITQLHETPWGGAVNLDAPGSPLVRAFIIDNAAYWVREYRLDGLRLDATHALIDTSATHVIAEMVDALRTAPSPPMVHAEDHRNLTTLVEPRDEGGWGLDAVWADDFHHIMRRHLAGDAHGYYEDFEGTTAELAWTIRQGWMFSGQHSRHMGARRGTDASAIPMHKFVVCLQNHDQIGNRATGDRLHHIIDPAAWRAASVILLTAPMTPLLFMGQEWAASTPFRYFTDLEPDLGRLVTEGRRREFRHFPEFADETRRLAIPDPQAVETFESSRLNWDERGQGHHALTLALYREILRLRRDHAALGASFDLAGDADALDEHTILMRRTHGTEAFFVVSRLSATGEAHIELPRGRAQVVLSTEDPRFAPDPLPVDVAVQPGSATVRFKRPGAVILAVA